MKGLGLPERRRAELAGGWEGFPEAGSVRSPQLQPWQCHPQRSVLGMDSDAEFLILLIQVPAQELGSLPLFSS